jgi:SAM-dependent methyltransferase
MEMYFSGKRLYGDDFNAVQVEQWFRDEENGYISLSPQESYSYGYHARNWRHGFRHLPERPFNDVLGMGSAYGDELKPVLARSKNVTILEPADGFNNDRFTYVKPSSSGKLPFQDASFDLITCLGVLHHIPNVSVVLAEMARVLRGGGYALICEPTHSMGDWRRSRKGLTTHERGIPLPIFRDLVRKSGFTVLRETRCHFSLTARFRYLVGDSPFNHSWIVTLDEFLCRIPIWSRSYHPSHWVQKIKPVAVFYVLTKREAI